VIVLTQLLDRAGDSLSLSEVSAYMRICVYASWWT